MIMGIEAINLIRLRHTRKNKIISNDRNGKKIKGKPTPETSKNFVLLLFLTNSMIESQLFSL